MNRRVFLFCGVESTGKTTTVNKLEKYLKSKGLNVVIVSEVGREVCDFSGGVFSMTHLDYEQILFLHQANFLKAYQDKNIDVILLDTDSIYTKYYLKKDEELNLKNKSLCEKLYNQADYIAKLNANKINAIIYLDSTSPFVQDGTRTYESSRKTDDNTLKKMYEKAYNAKNIITISGKEYEKRLMQIIKEINKQIK